MEISFDNKRILVTGAGQGMGRCFVKRLVKCGADVVALSLIEEELRTLKEELPQVTTITCDVADTARVRELVAAHGPYHGLVNNAGIIQLQPFLEVTEESFDRVMNVNLKSVLIISQVVAKMMVDNKIEGSIVNISSQASTPQNGEGAVGVGSPPAALKKTLQTPRPKEAGQAPTPSQGPPQINGLGQLSVNIQTEGETESGQQMNGAAKDGTSGVPTTSKNSLVPIEQKPPGQATQLGVRLQTAYNTSKGGVETLSKVMALELGEYGIRSNCIRPTVVMTELGRIGWSDPKKAKTMTDRIPLGRFVEVDEVADSVLFLLSDKSKMINGIGLLIDGGYLAN